MEHKKYTPTKSKDMSLRLVLTMMAYFAFDRDKEKVRQWWIGFFDKGLRKFQNKY